MRERYESSPRGDGYYYAGNPQIKPETSTEIEIGLKGQGDHFGYRLALWRNRITDYMSGLDISGTPRAVTICGAANAAACKETVNISKVSLHGFEAQGKWQAWRGHWLKAGLSVVRGTNDALDEPLFQMPADELNLGWEGNVAPGWTMDVTGRFVDRQDRVATAFSRGSENATPGFTTADIGATWSMSKQHRFRIVVKNLFDRAYHEHLTEGVSGQELQMPGRSLVLSWKGDF
jgi:hemoglobin/transferrin/lactoferrin receptor protein